MTTQHPNRNHAGVAAGAALIYDCVRCPNSVGAVKTLGSEALLCAECAVERLLLPESPRRPDAPDVTLQMSAADLAHMLSIAYEEGKLAALPPEVDAPAQQASPSKPASASAAPPALRQPDQNPPPAPQSQASAWDNGSAQNAPRPTQPGATASTGAKACKACQQPIQPQYTYCYDHRPPLCGQCGVNKLSWSSRRGDWFEVCYTCRPQRRAAA